MLHAMRAVMRTLAVGVLIGSSSWLAIELSRPQGGVSVIWAASGLLVGILLTTSHRHWSAYIFAALVGDLIARAACGDPPIDAAVRGLATTIEVCVVAYVLRYCVGEVGDEANLSRVSRIAPWATIVACALSALLVAAVAADRATASFELIFVAWFTSHLLGIVILATMLVVVRSRGILRFARCVMRWDFLLTMCLVASITLLVFSQSRYPLLFLIYPSLVLAAFRHHFDGAVVGIIVVVIASVAATLGGLGPLYLIADSSGQERATLLQIFVAMACLSTLPVAVVLSQRSRLRRALADGKQFLRAITDNLPALVSHIDTQQRYTFVNAYRKEITGVDAGTLIGHPMREVLGEETYLTLKDHVEAALRGKRVTFDGTSYAGGKQYCYESTYIPDLEKDGTVRGFYAMTFDITERTLARQELQRIAQHDSLTGLGNRIQFNDRLAHALARYRRNGRPFALVYLDIDYFKHINDSRGHAVGDAVLCEFARRLRVNVRETDLPARLGGDEFAVIVEDSESANALDAIAKKLIAAMRPDIVAADDRIQITTSIGIAVCAAATATAETLMLAADVALYEAKAAGRDTYRIANPGKEERTGRTVFPTAARDTRATADA
jgi:diguanylate cyclase (GGDEF)-like protein/PAS domain S-box-containing protein